MNADASRLRKDSQIDSRVECCTGDQIELISEHYSRHCRCHPSWYAPRARTIPIVAYNNAYRTLADSGQIDDLIGKSLFGVTPAEGTHEEHIRRSIESVIASGKPNSVTQLAWTFLHTPLAESAVENATADDDTTVRYVTQYIQAMPQASAEHANTSAKVEATVHHLLDTFEFAAIGFVLFDLNGRVLDCNASFAESLGQTREELQRAESASIVHPRGP